MTTVIKTRFYIRVVGAPLSFCLFLYTEPDCSYPDFDVQSGLEGGDEDVFRCFGIAKHLFLASCQRPCL